MQSHVCTPTARMLHFGHMHTHKSTHVYKAYPNQFGNIRTRTANPFVHIRTKRTPTKSCTHTNTCALPLVTILVAQKLFLQSLWLFKPCNQLNTTYGETRAAIYHYEEHSRHNGTYKKRIKYAKSWKKLHKSQYSGTPLMRTPLGASQSVLIRGLSLFQGLFCTHKICSGMHAVSTLQWMSAFQGCPQGRVPLYTGFCSLQ